MNQDHDISRIIYRCIIGTSTPEENEALEEWMSHAEKNREFVNQITNCHKIEEEIYARRVVNYKKAADEMSQLIKTRRKAHVLKKFMKAAAVVAGILLLGGAGYFFMNNTPEKNDTHTHVLAMSERPLILDSLQAGTSRAIIVDSNGKKEILSSSESGKCLSAYIDHPHSETRNMSVEVPRGAEFKVVLEDSTEVWLNAESTIRYPELFSSNERVVSVSGEVYFKVKEDKTRPFYVETDNQVIRVYGTSFNVRAYPDEEYTLTTLESGSISLRNRSGNSGEVVLSVGHQAQLDNNEGAVSLKVVDPETISSWRQGKFVLDDQSLEKIMRDLGRWYDFQYEFADDGLKSREFMGSIHRYDDFRTAIQILENCGDIKFSVSSDNKVLIMPSNSKTKGPTK